MFSTRLFALTIAVISSTSLVSAPDLSSYRQFRFGMTVGTVTRLAGIASEPRVLSQRPELIQEVMWLPRQERQTPDDRLKRESVRRANKAAFRP